MPDHRAYKVIPVETPGEYGKEIAAPPSVADQPSKVYPLRVGAVGALAIDSPVIKESLVTAEPPFESYVTVLLAGRLMITTPFAPVSPLPQPPVDCT
jgi:hypothetical protein